MVRKVEKLSEVLLNDEDMNERCKAARELAETGEGAIPSLAEAFKNDKEREVRSLAMFLLSGLMDRNDYYFLLIEGWDAGTRQHGMRNWISPDSETRQAAGIKLMQEHDDPGVRVAAINWISPDSDKSQIVLIKVMQEHGDLEVRRAATRRLSAIPKGVRNHNVIEALIGEMSDTAIASLRVLGDRGHLDNGELDHILSVYLYR